MRFKAPNKLNHHALPSNPLCVLASFNDASSCDWVRLGKPRARSEGIANDHCGGGGGVGQFAACRQGAPRQRNGREVGRTNRSNHE
jgi:hypothetical protein